MRRDPGRATCRHQAGVRKTQCIDRISSKDLIAELVNDEDGPWAAYGKSGKPIAPRQVAHLLSDFKIHPRNVRGAVGPKTASGYDRDWFTDLFIRYLDPPDLSRTPAQVNNINDLDENLSRTQGRAVRDKNQPNLLNNKDCARVRDKNPPPRDEGPKFEQCEPPDPDEWSYQYDDYPELPAELDRSKTRQ
jgi:hypothetical protein